jgi:hypothetical protein
LPVKIAAYGKIFKSSILGMSTIFMMQSANINAVQYLDFNKWAVEPVRRGRLCHDGKWSCRIGRFRVEPCQEGFEADF